MQERLQKIIARAGVASRRHAEQLILSGQVRVNGRVVTELGTKADAATDRIEAAGRVVKGAERRVYLVLNKPPGIEERRNAERVVSGAASGGEDEAGRIGAADRDRKSTRLNSSHPSIS